MCKEDDEVVESAVYEITWRLANGSDVWTHTRGLSFQGACREGLRHVGPDRFLVRILKMPDGYVPSGGWPTTLT